MSENTSEKVVLADNERKQIRSFTDLLKGSWGIFKGSLSTYLWLYLTQYLIILGYVWIAFGGSAMLSMLTTGNVAVDQGTVAFDMFKLGGLLLLIPVAVIIQLAIYKVVYSRGEGQEETLGGVLRYGASNIFSFLLVAMVLGLIVFGGTLLLIVPGIIFALMYSVCYPVFVVEGARGWAVFKRSKELTSGHKLAILKKYLIGFALYIFVAVVVSIAGNLFVGIPVVGSSIPGIASQVYSLVLAPVILAFGYLIYKDLVAAE